MNFSYQNCEENNFSRGQGSMFFPGLTLGGIVILFNRFVLA